MNIGRRIRQRFFRIYCRMRSRIHMRHWRGHGIHSPFMYGIVRQVFMKNRISGRDTQLYVQLRRNGINRNQSTILQNLYTHCRMESFTLVPEVGAVLPAGERNLCILLPDVSLETIASTVRRVADGHGCLAVLSLHQSARTRRFVCRIWEHYPCVSVDRRVMALFFFSLKFQPQHYRI